MSKTQSGESCCLACSAACGLQTGMPHAACAGPSLHCCMQCLEPICCRMHTAQGLELLCTLDTVYRAGLWHILHAALTLDVSCALGPGPVQIGPINLPHMLDPVQSAGLAWAPHAAQTSDGPHPSCVTQVLD